MLPSSINIYLSTAVVSLGLSEVEDVVESGASMFRDMSPSSVNNIVC